MNQYILDDDGDPVPCDDLMTWGRWFEDNSDRRRVALDIVNDYRISTVFLGLDHSFGQGPPLLFETMVFEGKKPVEVSGFTQRYSTRAEALAGHADVLASFMG